MGTVPDSASSPLTSPGALPGWSQASSCLCLSTWSQGPGQRLRVCLHCPRRSSASAGETLRASLAGACATPGVVGSRSSAGRAAWTGAQSSRVGSRWERVQRGWAGAGQGRGTWLGCRTTGSPGARSSPSDRQSRGFLSKFLDFIMSSWTTCCVLLFILNDFFFERQNYRGREEGLPSILWFSPHTAAMARLEPGAPSSAAFPGHSREAGTQLVPVWEAGVVGGGLACCALAPAKAE